jgi:antitoxin MazE
MTTRIQQWGNSLGIRIPRGLARDAGVQRGSSVDLRVEGNRLVVKPLARRSYELRDLLRRVSRANLHREADTGRAVGREVW